MAKLITANDDLPFRERLAKLPRENLLDIIHDQNPNLSKDVRRIEWVFANKLRHLNWSDGTQITERLMPNEELALLIDEPFSPKPALTRIGVSLEDQQRLHIAEDSVLWARMFLNIEPRAYQVLILRHPGLRKVLRAGRRLGKTFSLAVMLLHYSYTHNHGRCIVVAPMKTQAELIYQEIMRLASSNQIVKSSITRNVTSPQFTIEMSNGSTIRFFTSGIKSGGKADVVRGQEAHIIVLDELDYMHGDDLESLYAMLQKTAEDQPDKILVGASTPTGARGHFWQFCQSPDFKEFWYPSYCFESGQKVTMADGTYKNIESIQVGDSVFTEMGSQKVLRTFERDYDGELLDITTYGNTTKISVTPEHPFSSCIRTRKQSNSYGGIKDSFNWDWAKAKDLVSPDKRDMNSGCWLRYIYQTKELDVGEGAFLVKNISKRNFKGKVYNFEVENTNSYLVEGLLVHNCNPFFDGKQEEFFHNQYSEMGYRHEIEADWGEDTEGVYPRKYTDLAFTHPGWEYKADVTSARSFFVMGVDWDKYAAGTNIVVLEVCNDDYEDARFAGKTRLAYREETLKEEFTLTSSVNRIIELNSIFQPKFIYVDRGFGEVQVELLHKYGVEHPETNLRKRVVGIQFSETIEIIDPHTKQPVKKDLKPFMVDNLRQFLEKQEIIFPEQDEDLYLQLISYVVARVTPTGRPIFESTGNAQDHAHDALILACLAITQNYGELMRLHIARRGIAVSQEAFLPMFEADEREQDIAAEVWGSANRAPILHKRAMSVSMGRAGIRSIKRKTF